MMKDPLRGVGLMKEEVQNLVSSRIVRVKIFLSLILQPVDNNNPVFCSNI